MVLAHRIAHLWFIGVTLVTDLSYADPVQTDYVTFYKEKRYEDRLYFRLLADKDRCVVMLDTKNKPGSIEKTLMTNLTPPCRFVRTLNEIDFVTYPKKGTLVLIAGAPASREYVETHWNAPPHPLGIALLDQCSTEAQAVVVKTPEHYFLSKKRSGTMICPWIGGKDEKYYYDFAHDRIR